jgi:hypothetical protein
MVDSLEDLTDIGELVRLLAFSETSIVFPIAKDR